MTDIDRALAAYAPGEPSMKPDVLKQIIEIEEERKVLNQQQGPQYSGQIMINEPGKEPRPMSPQEILHAINTQVEEINSLREKNGMLENMVANLQKTISKLNHGQESSLMPSPSPSPSLMPPSITSLSPTISTPSVSPTSQDTFVDTLLKKIDALEKRNKELEKGVPPIPEVKEVKEVKEVIPHKSKSMPEIIVDISS
jgi:hypothetical protein